MNLESVYISKIKQRSVVKSLLDQGSKNCILLTPSQQAVNLRLFHLWEMEKNVCPAFFMVFFFLSVNCGKSCGTFVRHKWNLKKYEISLWKLWILAKDILEGWNRFIETVKTFTWLFTIQLCSIFLFPSLSFLKVKIIYKIIRKGRKPVLFVLFCFVFCFFGCATWLVGS